MITSYREVFTETDFSEVFSDQYLDTSKFYYKVFLNIPVIHWIYDIDKQKVFDYIKKEYAGSIQKTMIETWYDKDDKKNYIYNAMIILKDERMIKLQYEACILLMPGNDESFVNEFTKKIIGFKRVVKKKKTFELNLITHGDRSFDISSTEIKRTKLDLGLHYEDEFAQVDQVIRKRLNQKKDKGIVLLHGLSGTGKTTYLRYLIGKLKKRVLFVSPNIAQRITDPEFMQLLLDNQDSVLVIEDAENVVMDRNESGGSGVSNLLNLSDGLLSDCLNIQIVCSFNTPLQNIDSALLRKGRLIAKYEFDKLSVEKAQQLSDHIGKGTTITQPMSVSEIYNQEEKTFDKAKRKIGFVIAA
jgi:energy-coupling factor transporter ATP-binding protein EcfA2